jgi:hypothetical protein
VVLGGARVGGLEGCGFGEVIGVDRLWFWGVIGVNMVVVLGKFAGLVVCEVMATPASLRDIYSPVVQGWVLGR